ncbi:SRPBCC family protein [Ningiella sp. W23]|uniref:SRPBCC family protein n=1 Tax=Ningiella sp. W23 TaxID=3023715 RepID=UPI0037584922
MTIRVNIDVNRNFEVNEDIETVFSLLSDVPASAAHFPKVEALSPLSDDTFLWEMEKVALGAHIIQTAYACQYICDDENKTIEWVPIEGEGNAIVAGKWELSELENGTEISFETQAILTLPIMGLFQLAVSPLVKMEFTGMVDTYLTNLKALWS